MKGVAIKMDGVFYWFMRGDIVGISGGDGNWIVTGKTSRFIYLAPWTWAARVIGWNPCHDIEFCAGIFE